MSNERLRVFQGDDLGSSRVTPMARVDRRMTPLARVATCALLCVAGCANAQRTGAPPQEAASAAAPAYKSSDDPAAQSVKKDKSAEAEDRARGESMSAGAPAPATPPPPPAAAPVAPAAEPAPATESQKSLPPAPGAGDPHAASVAKARSQLAVARRELDIATSEHDCARACRALESMERAMRQVCELARSPEERRECTSAGEQVNSARTKVQNSCGACAGKPR